MTFYIYLFIGNFRRFCQIALFKRKKKKCIYRLKIYRDSRLNYRLLFKKKLKNSKILKMFICYSIRHSVTVSLFKYIFFSRRLQIWSQKKWKIYLVSISKDIINPSTAWFSLTMLKNPSFSFCSPGSFPNYSRFGLYTL